MATKSERRGSPTLFRHPDFMRLWAGQTISQFGAQITLLALPLTAVLYLHATPVQMGILGALAMAPFLLVGLFLGVYVDRGRRRPLLIGADAGRALLLLIVPALYALHRLSIGVLYGEEFLLGSLTVLFDVAYQSYLPSLVNSEALVEGNSKLEVSRAVAQIGGPGVAGLLVQWITAPLAIAVNAISYVGSVVSLLLIKAPEPPPSPQRTVGVWRQIKEGLDTVFKSPYLRSIAGCTATANLFNSMAQAVYVLYAVHRIGITPGLLGVIYGLGSAGALAGAVMADRLARRFGVGRLIVLTALVAAAGELLVPLARPPVPVGLPILVAAALIISVGGTMYNITQVSLRQAITPGRILGRMNASMRFVVWGVMPIGSLIGGVLGSHLGLRPTLVVAAIGGLGAPLWVRFSPVHSLMSQPTPVDAAPL